MLKIALLLRILSHLLTSHSFPLAQNLHGGELLQGHTKSEQEVVKRGSSNERVGLMRDMQTPIT